MKKVILFGGTSEGRELACKLSLLPLTLTVSVATDYGAELLEGIPGITVLTGRLDAEEMVGLFRREGYLLAVDATHPYATAVSQNIRFACREVNTPLLRLVREKQAADGAVTCKDAQEAAEYLKEKPGNILLTTGSKELEHIRISRTMQTGCSCGCSPQRRRLINACRSGFIHHTSSPCRDRLEKSSTKPSSGNLISA